MTTPEPGVRLPEEVAVVNVGLTLFADAVRDQAVPVQQVDWRIPDGGDPEMVEALERLYGERGEAIDRANDEVVRRLDQGVPQLVGCEPAEALLPDVSGRVLLHCGPDLAWADACDPLRRSLRAAAVAEGWAPDVAGADRLLEAGGVALEPAYRHDVVLPMATAIGPTQPLFAVDNPHGGTRAFAPLNQGSGDTAWFGRDTPGAVERLVFLRDVAGPLLREVLVHSGPVDLFALAAQGLQMGDDVHLRTQASTNLLIRTLLPHLVALPGDDRVELARFLSGNHLFFLNLAMAAAKAVAVWADQVEGSSVVTMMCRNGTTFGIRLAGSATVHLAPAPPVSDALYYPGHGPEDSAPDIGDSAVLELVGLGAAAAAGSPAVAGFLGGTMAAAAALTRQMQAVCVTQSTRFKLPTWHNAGTPLGVDVRPVVELETTPRVTTGILDATSGAGQVGAGVATAPLGCFRAAVAALARP
ncbi:MAG: oxamate carbamoyltransferase subunit AllG family protein [Oryzihumus sp.]